MSDRLDVAPAERRLLVSRSENFIRNVEESATELAFERTRSSRYLFCMPPDGEDMEFYSNAGFRIGNIAYRPLIMKKEPNQALEPTTMLGTSAAEQPLVPSMVAAHL